MYIKEFQHADPTNVPARIISEQYHKLTGLLWNFILVLFAGTWLTGAGYTLYGLLVHFAEMPEQWGDQHSRLDYLGNIAATGSVVSLLGLYGYSKALISDTDAGIC